MEEDDEPEGEDDEELDPAELDDDEEQASADEDGVSTAFRLRYDI